MHMWRSSLESRVWAADHRYKGMLEPCDIYLYIMGKKERESETERARVCVCVVCEGDCRYFAILI